MHRPGLLALALDIAWLTTAAHAQDPTAEIFFETNIRPLLVEQCAKCHGADKQSGGLRVDSRAALLAGGDSGPALIANDPEQSLLVRAVRRGEDLRMPPDNALADRQVADLVVWIRAGAAWPERAENVTAFAAARHWAFRPPAPPEPPSDPSGWSQGGIDRFVMAGLRSQNLKPAAAAAKAVLLRRATFDLTGLPPTPDEIAAFEADDSPAAFARVVDRLLASPQYGERWGRHWMDVVRYADTAGDNADYPIPEGHLYRDYIIAAFNNDKPYDEFVREQIAGDILARQGDTAKYAERVTATGFIALSRRFATMPKELWHLTIEDTIDTVGQAFLGLTLRCARCHDHKFDPVTAEDYYALYGIFDSTVYPYAGSEEYSSKSLNRSSFVPLVPPVTAAPAWESHRAEIARRQAALTQAENDGAEARQYNDLKARAAELHARIEQSATDATAAANAKEELAKLDADLVQAKRALDKALGKLRGHLRDVQRSSLPADVPGAYAVQEGEPHDVPVQGRGEPSQPGTVVKRNVPAFLRDNDLDIPPQSSGRLELAGWIVDKKNPLTARVMANRVWQYHFGRGLVATPSNFGLRGAAPTHPELLDWLAREFMNNGWSIKSLHRTIMLSRTYQQSSAVEAATASADPANTWYGRFDRRRLDAEALRDALMVVSGTLDLTPPGAHSFPPLNEWRWTQHNPFKTIYPSTHRSVYLMTQRLQRHPYLVLFDGPDTNYSTGLRTSATVPLQALYFLNNPWLAEQAQHFAARLLELELSPTARVEIALLLAWGRKSEAGEVDTMLGFVDAVRQELAATDVAEADRELASWTAFARVVLSANEFVYVD